MSTETIMEKPGHTNGAERTRSGFYYRPHVDIQEKPDELLLMADMPGVKPDEIDIHFEDGELTIHGSVPSREPEGGRYLLQEFGVGDFYRTFRVSEHIDAQKIHAEYHGGVLTLHLPKAESAKPRKISVKAV